MGKNVIYTIWLQHCIGYCNSRVNSIVNLFESSERVYRAGETELRMSGLFTPGQINKLLNKDLDNASRTLELAQKNDIGIITISSKDYPAMFRRIESPPLLFYIKGRLPDPSLFHVAIVGTRTPSALGARIAYDFARELAENKVVIISGGAEGIDMRSHMGAIAGGGNTVCVLGSGLNKPYPRGFEEERNEIIRHGAIISEYPPDFASSKFSFPDRNRLIAALSECTLVVEGNLGSGSLITAAKAVSQRKQLFAVPGGLDNAAAIGSNYLLSKGARAAVRSSDILDRYRTRRSPDDITPPPLTAKVIDDARNADFKRDAELQRYKNTGAASLDSLRGYEEIRDKERLVNEKQEPKPVAKKARSAVRTISGKNTEAQRKTSIRKEKTAIIHEKTDNTSSKMEKSTTRELSMLTNQALSVYHTISETPKSPEAISTELGIPVSDVMAALTELELYELTAVLGVDLYGPKTT